MKIRKPRTTQLEMQIVAHMYNTGKSITAIKEKTGRDQETIRRMLIDSGVTIRDKNEQRRLDYKLAKELPRNLTLTPMEVLACCGYGSGLDIKRLAWRMGYKDRQSARDLLRSASRKIKAREALEEQQ